MALKLQNKQFYPHLFIGVAALLTVLKVVLDDKFRSELLLSLVGALAAFVYFLYRRHLDETKLFKELFVEFNARYDGRNEELNRIKDAPETKPVEPEEQKVLFDYFNLSAEEYLFYKAGYIDEEVWQSWLRGMAYFASSSRVLRLWREEIGEQSYYGFPLEQVEQLVRQRIKREEDAISETVKVPKSSDGHGQPCA